MARIFVWDFTLKFEDQNLKLLKDNLNNNCKKWVFQLELSESGYKHYQGRFSLNKKKSLSSLISLFNNYEHWKGVHFSPTTKGVALSNNFNYVMKDDSRELGPWQDDDEEKIITKQMEMFDKWGLLSWQKHLKIISQIFDLRTIDLIYDPVGNAGKSLFSEHMEYCGLAEEVPPFRLMDDIFQWVCSRPVKKCYIFDLPRGMKKDKLGDFYSGIEVIKNGVAYDKRYSAKKIRFDRPRIFVFSNMLPQFGLMSRDRWRVWNIIDNKLAQASCEINED